MGELAVHAEPPAPGTACRVAVERCDPVRLGKDAVAILGKARLDKVRLGKVRGLRSQRDRNRLQGPLRMIRPPPNTPRSNLISAA